MLASGASENKMFKWTKVDFSLSYSPLFMVEGEETIEFSTWKHYFFELQLLEFPTDYIGGGILGTVQK